MPDPWDWIKLLGEEHQVRVLGYWDLTKRRNMDIGPCSAATLTNLLTIVGKTPVIREALGFTSRKSFDKYAGKVPEVRNSVMHPVRPMLLSNGDTKRIYEVLRFLEHIRNAIADRASAAVS